MRRSIGRHELRNFDPFILLDEFLGSGDSEFGFPDHPHRGFETVTYMLEGKFNHEDFAGHKGSIGPGDLQWMTAGRGIVHAEMPDLKPGQRVHGLQLWVNLRAKDKWVEPRYQELKAEAVTHVTKEGVKAIVIAGHALGEESPIKNLTPVHYIHFFLEPNATLQHPIPKSMNAFIYILSGTAEVGPNKSKCEAHHTITLTRGEDLDGVTVHNPTANTCEFVLLAGEPTHEPTVQHGPCERIRARSPLAQRNWSPYDGLLRECGAYGVV